jgi:hypothetical protein
MSVPAAYEVIAFNTAASSDTYRIIVCLAPGIMKTQPNPSDREVLAGLVERVAYQSYGNGFCVVQGRCGVFKLY